MHAKNDSAQKTIGQHSSDERSLGGKPVWHYFLLGVIPVVVLVSVFALSPNFKIDSQQTVHSYPPGGDYLQEYVGGWMISNQTHDQIVTPNQLYDVDAFKRIQHDPKVTGFAWDTDQYFPPVYPPFWYAAVSPLSSLPYPAAMRAWAMLMTACLIASLGLIYRHTDAPLALLMLFCISPPVIASISSGQKGTLLLLVFTGAMVLLVSGRPGRSGSVFALSLFKPYLGICIGVLMLISGRWRWVGATLLTVAAIVGGSWLRWPELCQGYLGVCLGFGDYVQSGGYELGKSYSLWSGWQLLIADGTAAKVLTLVSTLAVFAGSLFYLRPLMAVYREGMGSDETAESGHHENVGRNRIELSFAVMVLVTAVTAPHFYSYDLTMLILPAAVFAGHAVRQKFDRRNWLPTGLIGAAMFASGPIEKIAASSNVPVGAALLLAAIGSAISVANRSERR